MKVNTIIVAGGKGVRMQSDLPKQFIEIEGKPILMHTIEKFEKISDKIYLVLPKSHFSYWKKLVKDHSFRIPIYLAEGGEERFFSVKNTLNHILDDELVLIHDGVRPLISEKCIRRVLDAIEEKSGVIPVISITDSIRKITDSGSESVNRSDYKKVQTPQGFFSTNLKKAYNTDFSNSFTDDASVYEKVGFRIKLVQGDINNIKITTPEDLLVANTFFSYD